MVVVRTPGACAQHVPVPSSVTSAKGQSTPLAHGLHRRCRSAVPLMIGSPCTERSLGRTAAPWTSTFRPAVDRALSACCSRFFGRRRGPEHANPSRCGLDRDTIQGPQEREVCLRVDGGGRESVWEGKRRELRARASRSKTPSTNGCAVKCSYV